MPGVVSKGVRIPACSQAAGSQKFRTCSVILRSSSPSNAFSIYSGALKAPLKVLAVKLLGTGCSF